MSVNLNTDSLILFQGDSITDCNRRKLRPKDLGEGYVQLIQETLASQKAEKAPQCLNRGIFGNRTTDLKLRWRRDCLHHAPDVLSLLIGINDTWRKYDLGITTSLTKFEENYRYLLDSFKTKCPSSPIILMSPFLLPVTEEQEVWFDDLSPKIACVKALAEEYQTYYIPLQEIFENHISSEYPPSYWATDGVHPTLNGHTLIAEVWLDLFQSII